MLRRMWYSILWHCMTFGHSSSDATDRKADNYMELSIVKLLQILYKRIVLLVIVAVFGAALAFTYTLTFVKPQYVSTIKLMVSSESGTQGRQDIETLIRLVNSYVEMLDSRDFYEQLAAESQLDISAETVARRISFKINEDSEVFQAQVTSPSPEECEVLIYTLVSCAPHRVERIFHGVSLEVIESPNEPTATSTRLLFTTALGAVLSAAICGIIILMSEYFDTRCKDTETLIDRYNLPVLGSVPAVGRLNAANKQTKQDRDSSKHSDPPGDVLNR